MKIYLRYFVEHFKGDCLLVVGDEDLIKIHYHTNEPWLVLEYCASLGEIHDIVLENMAAAVRWSAWLILLWGNSWRLPVRQTLFSAWMAAGCSIDFLVWLQYNVHRITAPGPACFYTGRSGFAAVGRQA